MLIRRASDRGYADHGWLRTFHTFSFAGYYDPEHMGYRALRVINEDRVAPGQGFGAHAHRDMEIVSYVLAGALEHKDSMGNGSVIRPGDVQRMSAGTGVTHSEFNPSRDELVHFLQIWILPARQGTPPSYEQKNFPLAERRNRLRLIASPDGRDGSVTVHQDVSLYAGVLEPGEKLEYVSRPERHPWIHVATGAFDVDGTRLSAGDAAAPRKSGSIEIANAEAGEILVFDLA